MLCFSVIVFLQTMIAEKTCIKLREAEINSLQNLLKLCENQQFEYGFMLKKCH